MSNFHSDKCTKEELAFFKKEVLDWLYKNFPKTKKAKIRAYRCYNGDVRIYTGKYMELLNQRSSFRKTEMELLPNGKVSIHGTRGQHTTKFPEYISINRDEFDDIKKTWKAKKGDNWDWFNDLIFSKLK